MNHESPGLSPRVARYLVSVLGGSFFGKGFLGSGSARGWAHIGVLLSDSFGRPFRVGTGLGNVSAIEPAVVVEQERRRPEHRGIDRSTTASVV